MAIDLGTGDGRFVLAAAADRPDRLVIGVDANAAGMAEASRRAAAKPRRGGRPNALFVAAAAEALPPELNGLAELVTVHFPWGSLLRGLLGAEPAVLGGVARLLRPGARLDLLVSVTDRDHGAGSRPLDAQAVAALAPAYARQGLELGQPRPATTAEIAATHSTWAKRLRAGATRPTWLLTAHRSSAHAAPDSQPPPVTGQGGSLPPPAALWAPQRPRRGGSFEGGAQLPPRN